MSHNSLSMSMRSRGEGPASMASLSRVLFHCSQTAGVAAAPCYDISSPLHFGLTAALLALPPM